MCGATNVTRGVVRTGACVAETLVGSSRARDTHTRAARSSADRRIGFRPIAMFSGGAKASAAPGGASASDPDAALADLWARLSSATADRAHKKALKLADAILELLPGDGDATRCKVVALIELERHRDAVAACERHGAPDDLAFERAYALYKSHDAPDALALLERVSSNPSRTQLRAQLLHRAGRAAESADAYADLFETRGALAPDASARSAVATNLVASLVAAGRSADVADALRSAGVSPKEAHELDHADRTQHAEDCDVGRHALPADALPECSAI